MFCSSACAKKYRIRQTLEERATRVTAESRQQDAQRKESEFAGKDVMRVKDVCDYLSLSRATIYRYMEKGIIKPLVLPGVLLFRKDSLDQLFKDGVRFRELMSRVPKASPVAEQAHPFVHSDDYISIRTILEGVNFHMKSFAMYVYIKGRMSTDYCESVKETGIRR